MPFFPWTDEFLIGIGTIDEQHRRLVDTTNRLAEEFDKPEPDREVIGEILEGLLADAMNHFIFEEELFQRFGYPQAAAHKSEHDGFSGDVLNLLERFEGGANVEHDALNLLKDWLSHHILIVDKAYAPFLKEKGVA